MTDNVGQTISATESSLRLFFAASSVCQTPVISSSIKLSKVLPFYAVGSEINYQCSKPGYEIIQCNIHFDQKELKY
jgi:hypothetical protein